MSRNFKLVFVLAAVLAISVAAYAFAAANTVPATRAGDGSGAVTGYTITSVVYTLNGTNPSVLDEVSFDLGAAAVQVQVQLVTSGNWYACTLDTGTVWDCNTTSPALNVADIDQLRVVATSN